MTHAVHDLVIRSVATVDATELTDLVAAAMHDGPVARWLQPDDGVRHKGSPDYFAIFIEHTLRYGEIYATKDDTGRLTGAALWFPLTSELPSPVDYDRRLKEIAGEAHDRMCLLDAAMEAEHPTEPHHYLAFLAVRPDRQNLGLGSTLLRRHHRRLDAAGLPAYLEANDPRNRDLYLRHGYQVRSVIDLPDGPPLWTMWRPPLD
ncbi:GNAT family N-acetyltransferase [Paractinoplanes toevensis]|uniref:GCN5-like N-acetyltransferase n=1 Tax=Paractinoplanes toevensis TaxID=571911 RepID=A0A919T908_9ACTN|nr:GNAT family N-acetyltransferase [Actinoplanes toevensis]GIM91629.1 GCN5-like N-acetyltransferase [Actinoplanes toevensis]